MRGEFLLLEIQERVSVQDLPDGSGYGCEEWLLFFCNGRAQAKAHSLGVTGMLAGSVTIAPDLDCASERPKG